MKCSFKSTTVEIFMKEIRSADSVVVWLSWSISHLPEFCWKHFRRKGSPQPVLCLRKHLKCLLSWKESCVYANSDNLWLRRGCERVTFKNLCEEGAGWRRGWGSLWKIKTKPKPKAKLSVIWLYLWIMSHVDKRKIRRKKTLQGVSGLFTDDKVCLVNAY